MLIPTNNTQPVRTKKARFKNSMLMDDTKELFIHLLTAKMKMVSFGTMDVCSDDCEIIF